MNDIKHHSTDHSGMTIINATQPSSTTRPKFLNTKNIATSIAAITAVAVGAFIYWQYTPEVDIQPSNAPVHSMNMTSGKAIPLTAQIKNPAGITYLPDTDTYLISTDNRVVAEVTRDFSTVLSSMVVSAKPLNTGDTEGVTYLGDGEVAVLGENGVVVLLKRSEENWKETDRFPDNPEPLPIWREY